MRERESDCVGIFFTSCSSIRDGETLDLLVKSCLESRQQIIKLSQAIAASIDSLKLPKKMGSWRTSQNPVIYLVADRELSCAYIESI